MKCQISLISVQSTIHIQLVSLSAGEKISVKDALVDPRPFGHKWEHRDGPQDSGLEQLPGPNQQIINDKKIEWMFQSLSESYFRCVCLSKLHQLQDA